MTTGVALIDVLQSIRVAKVAIGLPGIRIVARELGTFIRATATQRLPDRRFLSRSVLPAVAHLGPRRLLFVGCRRYTVPYCKYLVKAGIETWTIDIDPAARRWSVGGKHIVGDIAQADELFPDRFFDAVILNGVFGFGVNTAEQMDRCLLALSNIVSSGGLLIIGWNTDKTVDPIFLGSTKRFLQYSHLALFQRHSVDSSTHVYDWLVKRAPELSA